jgi:hypothetical protein
MPIVFELGKHVRCDILTWSGTGFGGRQGRVRIFPGGNVQGVVEPENLRSMVIRAFHGTRVILAARAEGDFREGPWRCVRLLPGHTVAAERAGGMPGVRLPDIDRLDAPAARRTATDLEQSYPLVARLRDGVGWTFGQVGSGPLKGAVRRIIVEKDESVEEEEVPAGAPEADPRAAPVAPTRAPGEGERVARALLGRAREVAPDALPALLEAAAAALDPDSAAALRDWLECPR